MNKVNIAEKFQHIHEYWKPYIAAELNGHDPERLVRREGRSYVIIDRAGLEKLAGD